MMHATHLGRSKYYPSRAGNFLAIFALCLIAK